MQNHLKLKKTIFRGKQTIPTERPPLVDEVNAIFYKGRCVVSATNSHGR
jgi:hypothetical protein